MKSTIINESRMLGYKQTLQLAKTQLITLGGDNRDDVFGDKIQGNMLNMIDHILNDMDLVMYSMDEPIKVEG